MPSLLGVEGSQGACEHHVCLPLIRTFIFQYESSTRHERGKVTPLA
jgi:hypothetical protein